MSFSILIKEFFKEQSELKQECIKLLEQVANIVNGFKQQLEDNGSSREGEKRDSDFEKKARWLLFKKKMEEVKNRHESFGPIKSIGKAPKVEKVGVNYLRRASNELVKVADFLEQHNEIFNEEKQKSDYDDNIEKETGTKL